MSPNSLFRNKTFMLDEMFQRKASKFAILLEYENPHNGARSPVLRETILQNLLKYNVFSRNFDDYSKVVEVN